MYERFTDHARKVMQMATQEAQRYNHEYIGTEHILLGLIKDRPGVAAHVLEKMDVDLRRARLQVEMLVGAGPDMVTMGKLPQTSHARKVIEHSIEEARNLNHNYVSTEHLLLGLLREQEGVAFQVLMNLGLKPDQIRAETCRVLGWDSTSQAPVPASEKLAAPAKAKAEKYDVPAAVEKELADLANQVERLNRDKWAAIGENLFERAAELRHQTVKLQEKELAVRHGWMNRYAVDPAWLQWNDGEVPIIAKAISAERMWGHLPLLGEALEKAGCANPEILGHCRQPGDHDKNCWVIDLLLGPVSG